MEKFPLSLETKVVTINTNTTITSLFRSFYYILLLLFIISIEKIIFFFIYLYIIIEKSKWMLLCKWRKGTKQMPKRFFNPHTRPRFPFLSLTPVWLPSLSNVIIYIILFQGNCCCFCCLWRKYLHYSIWICRQVNSVQTLTLLAIIYLYIQIIQERRRERKKYFEYLDCQGEIFFCQNS